MISVFQPDTSEGGGQLTAEDIPGFLATEHLLDLCPQLLAGFDENCMSPVELSDLLTEFCKTLISEYDGLLKPVAMVHSEWRWVLMSYLQKSLRRGWTEHALMAASALWNSNQRKLLYSRLITVGLEDLGLCGLPMLNLSFEMHKLDEDALGQTPFAIAAGLVTLMCDAVKDRSVCELLVISMFKSPEYQQAMEGIEYTIDEAHGALLDYSKPMVHRMAAMKRISGNGQAATEARKSAFSTMKLPPFITNTIYGYKALKRDAMWMALPVCWQQAGVGTLGTVKHDVVDKFSAKGIPCIALDMYTRDGKRAMSRFRSQVKEIKEFFAIRPGLDFQAVIGCAVFTVEGSLLDTTLDFYGRDAITYASIRDEFFSVGLNQQEAVQLCEMVEQNKDILMAARQHCLSQDVLTKI